MFSCTWEMSSYGIAATSIAWSELCSYRALTSSILLYQERRKKQKPKTKPTYLKHNGSSCPQRSFPVSDPAQRRRSPGPDSQDNQDWRCPGVPTQAPVLITPGSFWAFFSGCLRTVLTAITRASACSLVFFCLSFPHISYHNRVFEPVATDYLKTDWSILQF